jgi:hypothetical protein
MKYMPLLVVLLFSIVAAKAADHIVHLQITSHGGRIGWHFSRYNGPYTWKVILYKVPNDFHAGNSTFTNIVAEDDSTRRMKRGENYDKKFTVRGPGIFVLNFSDRNHTARIEVRLNVDGQDWFRGSGSSKNIHDWTPEWGKWSAYVRQTDYREIAIQLK